MGFFVGNSTARIPIITRASSPAIAAGHAGKADALSTMFGDRSASRCGMMARSLPPSSTGERVAAASEDKTARIWSAPPNQGRLA
jgi:hypothetical protein